MLTILQYDIKQKYHVAKISNKITISSKIAVLTVLQYENNKYEIKQKYHAAKISNKITTISSKITVLTILQYENNKILCSKNK